MTFLFVSGSSPTSSTGPDGRPFLSLHRGDRTIIHGIPMVGKSASIPILNCAHAMGTLCVVITGPV